MVKRCSVSRALLLICVVCATSVVQPIVLNVHGQQAPPAVVSQGRQPKPVSPEQQAFIRVRRDLLRPGPKAGTYDRCSDGRIETAGSHVEHLADAVRR